MPEKGDIQGLSGIRKPSPIVEAIIKLTLLLFDSFGIKLCPEVTAFIKNALKGKVKFAIKLNRFCEKDIWPGAQIELAGYTTVKTEKTIV